MGRLVLVGCLATALLAAPLAVEGQPVGKVRHIGFLSADAAASSSAAVDALRQGLRAVGYIEGRNLAIAWRFAEGRTDSVATLATELVGLPVDLTVTNSASAAFSLRAANSKIPIVLAGVDLRWLNVGSLARPGGNLTGISSMASELEPKRMELLKEAVRAVSRVVVLRDLTLVAGDSRANAIFRAERWGVTFIAIPVRGPEDFRGAFATAARERADALSVAHFPLFYAQRRQLADLATKGRLAWVAESRQYAEAGSLRSYGADAADLVRRSATYVDRILKGANPGMLPIEQAAKFEFVIDLKTAKALGLAIPQSVLVRADEVIE